MLICWQMYTSLCRWITQEQVLFHLSGFGYNSGSSLDRGWVQYTQSTLKLSDGNTYAVVIAGFNDVIALSISDQLIQRTQTPTLAVTNSLTALTSSASAANSYEIYIISTELLRALWSLTCTLLWKSYQSTNQVTGPREFNLRWKCCQDGKAIR